LREVTVEGDNRQEPKKHGDQSAHHPSAIAAAIPNNETKTDCHNCKGYPGYKIALEILTLLFAIASAIAAGFAVHYYNFQWREMHKQTVIQRNVSVTTERAWLAVTSGAIHFVPNAKGLRAVFVDMEVRNSGKTPAKQVLAEVVVDIVPNGRKWSAEYNPPTTGQIANVLLANDSMKFTATVQHLSPSGGGEQTLLSQADWQQLIEGREYIVTYSRMTYRDSFGRWHWQHFCSWSSPIHGQFSATDCTSYNDMDQTDLDDETTEGPSPKDPYLSGGQIRNRGPAPMSFSTPTDTDKTADVDLTK
jgi:hypothetical protein